MNSQAKGENGVGPTVSARPARENRAVLAGLDGGVKLADRHAGQFGSNSAFLAGAGDRFDEVDDASAQHGVIDPGKGAVELDAF